nr:immunoglobulin heavy chain junction region [Macaca mulatta]
CARHIAGTWGLDYW